jgi:hypothetical protein
MTSVLATVRDTVNPKGMPIDGTYEAVLAYRDGLFRWMPADAERFHAAGKRVYPCSVVGADPDLAQVVDCENGDLTIAQAADWARRRNDLHGDATIYASLDTIWNAKPSLIEALGSEPCWLWAAWWNASLQVPGLSLPANIRLAAVQWRGLPGWDVSAIISSEWPAHPYTDMANW